MLADSRINVNATDDLTGRTPLHEAAQHNDMADVVKVLLTSTTIDVNALDRGDGSWSNGLAPLHYACAKGNEKVAVRAESLLAVRYACAKGNKQVLVRVGPRGMRGSR